MLAKYKSHNNSLYNKLVELSRNIFFYKKIRLKDAFETRIVLILVHLSLIMIIFKKNKFKKFPQDIFDNIFLNIEYHLREVGLGDVSVNKKMKDLNRNFYDILLKIDNGAKESFELDQNVLKNHFNLKDEISEQNVLELSSYFIKFYNFCFVLSDEIMIKGQINFKY